MVVFNCDTFINEIHQLNKLHLYIQFTVQYKKILFVPGFVQLKVHYASEINIFLFFRYVKRVLNCAKYSQCIWQMSITVKYRKNGQIKFGK
jgi:hypothetical protein